MPTAPQNTAYTAAILLAAATAHAQTTTNSVPTNSATNGTSTHLPDVVVQGSGESFKVDRAASPKFTAPLLDTPQTVVALPKELFNQQGAASLTDVLRNTPGITFAAGEGGSVASGDSFFLRGSDASGNIFIDGVRDTGAYTRDIYNVEQVDIVKGPAGADVGRGASSGYVNMATKTPKLDPFYGATISYGSADKKRLAADLNQPTPIGKEGEWLQGTALRLNGMWQETGVPGRDFVENKSWGVAPSLALGLGTPTRVTVAVAYNEQHNLPDSGLPVAALPDSLPTTPVTGPVNQENYYGLANQDFEDVINKGITAKVEHDFNEDLTLRNQFKYGNTDRDGLTTYFQNSGYPSYNPTNAVATPRRIRVQNENETFSDQVNLTAKFETGFIEHSTSSGLEFTREEQYSPAWTAVSGPPTSIYSPDPYRPVNPATQVPTRFGDLYARGTIDSAAVYANDTLKLNKYFQLSGGVRWEAYNVGSRTAAPAGITEVSSSGDLLSGKGGLVFKPRENGSLYFAYGNSLTPPGTAFALSTATNNANNASLFKPQESINYEVGTKWDFFNQRLSATAAVFRSENLNMVVQDPATLEFLQDAKTTVDGVELGLSGKITENWFVQSGVGFMDTEYTTSLSNVPNTGAALRYAPKYTANLWTSYRLPFGLTLGGGIQYSDSILRSTSTTQTTTATALPGNNSYWVLNSMASYDVNKHLTLRLNVNNLTDESYFRLNNNGGRYYPGIPRSFLLSAEMKF
ncbi:MAG TPA: TonB-dependent siderophore receptor [Candidatus Limnocylindria bacterium]|jgi:catecholate siderophore receptor|nr:TonB-dependent siderophore receptor [Candidatus Limnocylindria bacterium]